MKSTPRILFIFAICALLAACTPQPASTPVPTATRAPTASSTPSPTATPTHTPEPSPTPLPAYADWMKPYVEGLTTIEENGITYLTAKLEDGREIKEFEYVEGKWRPSYKSMKDLFNQENKTFDLETAKKYMLVRMGPVADVDGQPAMSVDMDDYARLSQEAKEIWSNCSDLVTANFDAIPAGTYGSLDTGYEYLLNLSGTDQQWQVIGYAHNPSGEESVIVIATLDGPVALLNVGKIGYERGNNVDSVEEAVEEMANQTSTDIGAGAVIMLLLGQSSNEAVFAGKVDWKKVELMHRYLSGMGFNEQEIKTMMFGGEAEKQKALTYMYGLGPVPVYDIDDDRGN